MTHSPRDVSLHSRYESHLERLGHSSFQTSEQRALRSLLPSLPRSSDRPSTRLPASAFGDILTNVSGLTLQVIGAKSNKTIILSTSQSRSTFVLALCALNDGCPRLRLACVPSLPFALPLFSARSTQSTGFFLVRSCKQAHPNMPRSVTRPPKKKMDEEVRRSPRELTGYYLDTRTRISVGMRRELRCWQIWGQGVKKPTGCRNRTLDRPLSVTAVCQ